MIYRHAFIVLTVLIAGLMLAPSRARAQQAGPSTPSPRALALARSTFPSSASVQSHMASNTSAAAASMLHSAPFAQPGWVSGWLQTAQWMARLSHRGENRSLTLSYVASIFASPDMALAALGDARASLWELGHPTRVKGVDEPTFAVAERDGHRDIFVLLQQDRIEAEMRLRYGSSLALPSLQWSEWYLGQAIAAATRAMGRTAGLLPPVPPPPASSTTPPPTGSTTSPPVGSATASPFVAPWGTGPVVKSPSLMVLTASSPDDGADAGEYRTPTGPPLASRVAPYAALIPAGSLSRYARTAAASAWEGWYNTTTLYPSVAEAQKAWDAIVHANTSRRTLRTLALAPPPGPPVDGWSAWRSPGELLLLVRTQNVLMVLATAGHAPTEVGELGGMLLADVPTWLHAQGTQIVNAAGAPVHLAYLNWYGAEQQDFVVGGLDYRSYQDVLTSIASMGYTGIRLPFSNQLVEQNPVVTTHVRANPELAGLHALDVMDRVIAYAGALGLSVVLDDHRSDAGWSAQETGLWYTPAYPDAAFDHDWSIMAAHYAVNNVVIGADLRNEPHATATWGDGNPATDWHAAAERAGDAALAANPHLLIMVEGIQFYGTSGTYWWGGNLMGVAAAPVDLHFADGSSARSQLVYSPHDYGPDNCTFGCTWFNPTTTYDSLAGIWDQFWGFINADPTKPYAAPVWVGEFGTCNYGLQCVQDTAPGSQGQWFSSFVHYIATKHLSWAYWSANGTQSTAAPTRVYGALDWYGLFAQNWVEPVSWINAALASIETDDTGE